MESFVLKGQIVYAPSPQKIQCVENGYLVCENGLSKGVFPTLPEEYRGLPLQDFGNKLILPGMVDLHIHAPQFSYRGTGMDLELLPWLNTYTFPEESRFMDLSYAHKAYSLFARAMKKSATTRAVIFATRHREATVLLMDMMERTGLESYVGKINMDREAMPGLEEKDALDSAFSTFGWINSIQGCFRRTKPILTPRFIPCCSDELMNELWEIQRTYHIPVQSHLSENKGEIQWVKELCPISRFYGDAYDRFGLFGGEAKTVMAHCVYSTEEEVALMKKNGVFVAHCPSSNINLASGIAPIRSYLDKGLKIGLGSDVAGGESESMFHAVVQAIQASKLYWRLVDENAKPLCLEEAFYLATKGGGEFFGKVGSFEEGYELDALVLDDSINPAPFEMDLRHRLERAIYLSTDLTGLQGKYVHGHRIF